MSFDIRIDYRFDTEGFFDAPGARAAMEAAAGVWEALIRDDFAPVPAGSSFALADPSAPTTSAEVTLAEPIEDLLVFVGATTLEGRTLAFGGPVGFGLEGDVYRARIGGTFRDLGPATDFEPWAGSVTFDLDGNWSFAADGPEPGIQDFLSTAVHEIGHVLGIATAPIYNLQRDAEGFTGVNARAVNDGAAVPLESDGHVRDRFRSDTVLMDPTNGPGTRKQPTAVDLALLADIGYEIEGFAAQGTPLPLVTEAGETVRGTELADRIDALGGDDRVLGSGGDDTLTGGGGADSLLGEAGADSFRIAPGDGLVRVLDFVQGEDRILLAPGLGVDDVGALLAGAGKPFANVTEIAFPAGPVLRVLHEDQPGTPLRESDFAFDTIAEVRGSAGSDTLTGGPGDDRIDGRGGDDAVLASGGTDSVLGGAGTDRVVYDAPRALIAPVLATDGTVTIAKPGGGRDSLDGIERVALTDGVFLYDLESPFAGLAYRLFAAALDRRPAEEGLRHWTGELDAGRAPESIAAAFAGSAEFEAMFGPALTDADFVTALFESVLDRPPAPDGLAFWEGELAEGAAGRAGLLLAFADSAENVARTAPDLEDGIFVPAETDPLLL